MVFNPLESMCMYAICFFAFSALPELLYDADL